MNFEWGLYFSCVRATVGWYEPWWTSPARAPDVDLHLLAPGAPFAPAASAQPIGSSSCSF